MWAAFNLFGIDDLEPGRARRSARLEVVRPKNVVGQFGCSFPNSEAVPGVPEPAHCAYAFIAGRL